jgi:GT2 family glycosyltransferase
MLIAVLLTTFNRKKKTLECLQSLYSAQLPPDWEIKVFLTDDNSTDDTVEEVLTSFPDVDIEVSQGDLFWARGMNVSWRRSMRHGRADAYLLLNDDVVLYPDFWQNIQYTNSYCLEKHSSQGLYVCSTQDANSLEITYGGRIVSNLMFKIESILINPTDFPQPCQITETNILYVPSNVVEQIGVFDDNYVHGLADYDYSLTAYSQNIPIYVTPNFGGICENDHGPNWLSSDFSFKQRLQYLKSPKGLAFKEYKYYLKKHFPYYAPIGVILLLLKTFFPIFWDKFKK